jgi:hypothetical protein
LFVKFHQVSSQHENRPAQENQEDDDMPVKKIAMSLPEPVLKTVDRLAARRGESRSRVIATILSRVTRVKRDRDITTQIDALFADEAIVAEQKRTADELLRMGPWTKGEW